MKVKLLVSVLLAALLLAACAKKEQAPNADSAQAKTEPKQAVVMIDTPLPPFSQVFARLENLKSSDYDKVIPDVYAKDQTDPYKAAFELGKLSAGAILVTKAQNKAKLLMIAEKMLNYSKLIGINDEILKLAATLEDLIKKDAWTELEAQLENYKKMVEKQLYDTERDMYTLLKTGGWVEGLNRMCQLMLLDFDPAKTSMVTEKGILNTLLLNVERIGNPDVTSQAYYRTTLNNLKQIREIIYSSEDGTHTKEAIESMYRLSADIRNSY